MTGRSRTFSETIPRGTRSRFGTTVGTGQFIERERRTCTDVLGPTDCDPFNVDGWRYEGGVINNDYYSHFGGHFVDYVADVLVTPANFPHLSLPPGTISDIEVATSAAARTSPSRPYVDVPTALLELREAYQLVKDAGDSLIRQFGNANLKLQFGYAPIVSDLSKFVRFQEQVARRVRDIERLSGERGLRKTVSIGSYDVYGSGNIVCQSADAFINVPRNINTHVDIRCHTRWIPSISTLHLMPPKEMSALARQAVLGLTVDFSTVWNILPWSWMLDWCGNIGTFLVSQRNIIPATLSDVVVMRHTTTKHVTSGYSDPGSGNRKMTPIRFTRETKNRAKSFVAPVAHWPFLSANQMGIVASLAVTR